MRRQSPIGLCIERSYAAKDGRGRAQAERLCAAELGGSSIDASAAAAARRIGEWLHHRVNELRRDLVATLTRGG